MQPWDLGPLITLPVERFFNEPIVADTWTWASLAVTLVGALLYVTESLYQQDINELGIAILLCVVNLLVAIFERLYQRKLIAVQPVDISKSGMLMLNNIGGVLPVTLLLYVPGLDDEPALWRTRWTTADSGDFFMLFVSGVCGIAIGWTAINVQKHVTATTMLLITNLNKIVVVVVGMLFMGDPHTPLAILGMFLALGGSGCYGIVRDRIAQK
jgi:drug/metabolite transporter (DMT)-like permease